MRRSKKPEPNDSKFQPGTVVRMKGSITRVLMECTDKGWTYALQGYGRALDRRRLQFRDGQARVIHVEGTVIHDWKSYTLQQPETLL